jgi:hypothetical protein
MELTKKQIIEGVISEQASKSGNKDFSKMVSEILTSRNQTHIFHLQTKSFAEHKALNDYYDEIGDLFDGLVESYQGKYGIISDYTCGGVVQYKNNKETIKYFEDLVKSVEKLRKSVKDTYLENQIDSIVELIYSTIYKLRFLS